MSRTNTNTAGNYFSATIDWLPTNATVLWRMKTSFDTALITVLGQRSDANTGFGVHRDHTNDRIHFVTYGHTDLYSDTNSWPADGAMHVFAITKSTNAVSFYVDGVAAGTGTLGGATATTGDVLALGALWYDTSGVLNNISGELAEVALFSRVLSAGELRRYYLGESPNNYSTSLDHYWKLNESSGDATATTGTTMTQTGTMGSATHPTMNYTGAVNVNPKSIGTSSRNYSTIQAWEDACPSDLTVSNEVWKGECYNDSEFVLTAYVTFSGITTNDTCYVWLTTASGQGFKDHASKNTNPLFYDASKGVAIRVASATPAYILYGTTNLRVRLSNLQLKVDSTSTASYLLGLAVSTLDNCLLHNEGPGANFDSNGYVEATNCVYYMNGPDSLTVLYAQYIFAVFRNCTFVASSNSINCGIFYGADEFASAAAEFQNCVVLGFSYIQDALSGDAEVWTGSDHNATDLAAPAGWGTNSLANLTASAQLENLTSNLRAKASGALRAAGARDQTYTFDLDIFGNARSTTTPTIGAHEVASVVLSSPELINIGATTATPRVTVDLP